MNGVQTMLVAIGGVPHSMTTLRFAHLIAKVTGARARVLTAVRRPGEVEPAAAAVASALEGLAGLDPDPIVVLGAPTAQILRVAEDEAHDLIVVGARERPTLVDQLLGSVARRVVARAATSVLVVKRERAALERLLICTGGRDYADPAIEMGIGLARAAGAAVTVLYVVMPPPTMLAGLPSVAETLEELLRSGTPVARHLGQAAETLAAAGVAGGLKLRQGAVVDEILREARQGDYDLIVLGAPREQGLLTKYLMGNVAGDVLLQAGRPVLVVRRSEPKGKKGD